MCCTSLRPITPAEGVSAGWQVLTKRLRLEGQFDFDAVAAKTPGFVGADLAALTKEAAAAAISRIFALLECQGQVCYSTVYLTCQV